MNTHTLEKWLSPKGLLWASVVVACITIALKTLAWHLTDSVGLLSDAMESLVNLASAVFGLMMVHLNAQQMHRICQIRNVLLDFWKLKLL